MSKSKDPLGHNFILDNIFGSDTVSSSTIPNHQLNTNQTASTQKKNEDILARIFSELNVPLENSNNSNKLNNNNAHLLENINNQKNNLMLSDNSASPYKYKKYEIIDSEENGKIRELLLNMWPHETCPSHSTFVEKKLSLSSSNEKIDTNNENFDKILGAIFIEVNNPISDKDQNKKNNTEIKQQSPSIVPTISTSTAMISPSESTQTAIISLPSESPTTTSTSLTTPTTTPTKITQTGSSSWLSGALKIGLVGVMTDFVTTSVLFSGGAPVVVPVLLVIGGIEVVRMARRVDGEEKIQLNLTKEDQKNLSESNSQYLYMKILESENEKEKL